MDTWSVVAVASCVGGSWEGSDGGRGEEGDDVRVDGEGDTGEGRGDKGDTRSLVGVACVRGEDGDVSMVEGEGDDHTAVPCGKMYMYIHFKIT